MYGRFRTSLLNSTSTLAIPKIPLAFKNTQTNLVRVDFNNLAYYALKYKYKRILNILQWQLTSCVSCGRSRYITYHQC